MSDTMRDEWLDDGTECQRCYGTGDEPDGTECRECHGAG